MKTPEVVSLATWFAWTSVNQRLPSGPVAMLYGTLLRVVATGYSVMSPTVARALPLNTIGSAANSTNSLAAPNTPWPSRIPRDLGIGDLALWIGMGLPREARLGVRRVC